MRERACGLVLLSAAALLAPLAGTGAGQERDFEHYVELVLRYRDGGSEAVERRLAAWSDDEATRAVYALRDAFRRQAPVAPRATAVALHTETAFGLRERGLHDRADLHLELAHELVQAIPEPPSEADARLSRAWFRAAGLHYTMHALVAQAGDLLEEGLDHHPHDARLWRARGGVDELIATVGARREDGRTVAQRRSRDRPEDHFERAARAYESALEIDPQALDSRLRLARVRQRLGDLDEAEEQLQMVLGAGPGGDLAFLAELFRGDLLEGRGHLGPAVAAYRRAVALHPDSSSARLALSNALLRSGDRAGAAAAVRAALAASDREDLWLSYLAGVRDLEDARDALRALATAGGAE